MICDFNSICPDSKLWIFSSKRQLSLDEQARISSFLSKFLIHWESHNKSLLSSIKIFKSIFVVIAVDEKKQKVFYIELIVEHYKDLIKAGEELETILKTESEKKKEAKEKNEDNLRQEREADNKSKEQENLSEQEQINNKEKELFEKEAKENESSDLLVMCIFAALIITVAVANL